MRFHLAPKTALFLPSFLWSPFPHPWIKIWVQAGYWFLEDLNKIIPPCVVNAVLSPYLERLGRNLWSNPTASLPPHRPLFCVPWTSPSPVLSSSVVSASRNPFPAPLHIVLRWSLCPGWSSLVTLLLPLGFPNCTHVLFSCRKANCPT